MKTTTKEKQNKIVLRLMAVSLIVIIIATILVIVLFGVNIFDTNLSLTGKIFLNMAIILTSSFVIFPSFYRYFDKILELQKISTELKDKLNKIQKISNQAENNADKIRKDTLELIDKFRKKIDKNHQEITKNTLIEAEKMWQARWEKKFAKLKKLEKKYKTN